MALFSRGSKHAHPKDGASDATTPDEQAAADTAGPGERAAAPQPSETPADAGEAGTTDTAAPAGDTATVGAADTSAPHVGISVSSYGGFGANAVVPPPAPTPGEATGEAPPPTESVPGLPDNVVLRAALAALGDDPQPPEILGVARQLLQGNLYLRVKGDAHALVEAGAEIPLAVATRDDGQFVLAYSSGAALAAAVNADGDVETSALGQAASLVLQYVVQNTFDGLILDQASAPASVVLPRTLLERMLEDVDPALTLKRLVSEPRTADTPAAVAQALTSVPLWIAVNRASENDDWGVAESRMLDGTRILPVFSHPLEVIAVGHGDQPMPFTGAQLGSALRQDTGIDGIVIDPAGPWMRLGRADLGAVMALPEPEGVDAAADAPAPSADDEPASGVRATTSPDDGDVREV